MLMVLVGQQKCYWLSPREGKQLLLRLKLFFYSFYESYEKISFVLPPVPFAPRSYGAGKIWFEPICFQILWQFGMCGGAAPSLFTPTIRATHCGASKLRSSYFKNTPPIETGSRQRGIIPKYRGMKLDFCSLVKL